MLAYAANRPAPVDRRPHPNAMLMIVGAHVALLAAVMSAKMEIPIRLPNGPILINPIPEPLPPPPNPTAHPPRSQPGPTVTHDPTPVPPLPNPTFPTGPAVHSDPLPAPGPAALPDPTPTRSV